MNPVIKRSRVAIDSEAQVWQNTLLTTLAEAAQLLPFSQQDWPLPATALLRGVQSEIQQSLALFTTTPFSQQDWPIPRRRPDSVAISGWLQSQNLSLTASVAPFPFSLQDWPVPIRRTDSVAISGWLQSQNLSLNGVVSLQDFPWDLDVILTCRGNGAGGAVMSQGLLEYLKTGATDELAVAMQNVAVVPVDFSASFNFDLVAQWGAPTAGEQIVLTNLAVEILGE